MKFRDYTLMDGDIRSRREHESDDLAPRAVAICRKMLARLRRGEESVEHGLPDMVRFAVSLGLPDFAPDDPALTEDMRAPSRFFCVGEPGQIPYQINLVLPQDAAGEVDQRAIATLMGLTVPKAPSQELIDRVVGEIWETRPCLATAILPFTTNTELVRVAADFSTCFAAAMLLEE